MTKNVRVVVSTMLNEPINERISEHFVHYVGKVLYNRGSVSSGLCEMYLVSNEKFKINEGIPALNEFFKMIKNEWYETFYFADEDIKEIYDSIYDEVEIMKSECSHQNSTLLHDKEWKCNDCGAEWTAD